MSKRLDLFCFDKNVVDSDKFLLDLPRSSQLLYFHLAIRADNTGLVNNGISFIKTFCNDGDMRVLIEAGYITLKKGQVFMKPTASL